MMLRKGTTNIAQQFAGLVMLLAILIAGSAYAQCPINVAPSFPSSCTSQYFTSVTASGVGVTSTVSYTGTTCAGIYFNMYGTQGVTAATGTTVSINISRVTGYLAYLGVYVDWNNNGTYETSELAGTIMTLPSAVGTAVYNFTIPVTGIVTNTNLHMRVFLGEPPTASSGLSSIDPPCSAKWGQANDYYLNATCTTPTLAVTPSSPSVCGSTGSVVLTASGVSGTATYGWSPGTGLSATAGSSVTATPGVTTTYTVTGYAPGVCTSTGTATVNVVTPITPVITASGPTSICPGGSVTLTETVAASTYQWYAGTTIIPGATDNAYTASPAATTTYSVSVTASGCTSSATSTVTILPVPVAVITPVGATTVCSPATVTLNANFAPGYTYRWFNASGVIATATTQSYTATATGTYSVEITSAAGCKDTSAGVTITINPAPVATITASGPLTFCAYDSVTLTAGAGTGYTYQWLDGAANIPGATNATYVVHTVGTHDYRVRVTNGFGCTNTSASGLFIVVVNPAPVSTISASGPLSFCVGSSVTLSVPSVAGYTYQWYYGTTLASAAPIGGATTPTYTTSTTGYYYIKVTTPAGCTTNSAANAALVTVVSLPGIIHTTPLHICWGSHVALSLGISSSAPGITYQWQKNGVNIPGATATTFNATQTGSYTAIVNVVGSCIGTTPSVAVTVVPLPDPVVTYSGGYLKTANIYTHYQWYRNLAAIPGATTYRIAPTNTADYSVIVTDTNGCVSQATVYPLRSVELAASQVQGSEAPAIYPNPASATVYVEHTQPVNITVSSIDGKLLLQASMAKEINIASLARGLYIINLYDQAGNRLLTSKLIKQ